ncbi:MAG: UvrD-helicase domain-containing protein [Candidatus Moraniibacteriota bacterium]
MNNKEKILFAAREHLAEVFVSIKKSCKELQKTLKLSEERFGSLSYGDQIVERSVIVFGKKRADELEHLKTSPYFVRCDVVFQNDEIESSIYFAKFGFDKESIYSWVTPASVMRFERPGDVCYKRPDGTLQKARLLRKDQYMIVEGKLKFLSSEAIDAPRELIYEEYFSTQKSGFILPEIVAQMEKAQDSVIRAHHAGPFLISGPAGSGKTTLALHRVAYLAQSPDLAQIYTGKSIVVFVQDNGTKEYFSHLLPELGISDVKIATFFEWAFEILGISGNSIDRYGSFEWEKDLYEFQKLKALRKMPKETYSTTNTFLVLEKIYATYFDEKQKALFRRQSVENLYDRIDLTVLLKIFQKNNGELNVVRDYYVEQKNGKMKKKRGSIKLEYSLAVIDEFQNYLPDQLKLVRSCINKKTQAALYVGDMAQQVKLGTIRQWEEIGEKMECERKVVLEKVYRNTKNILLFIRQLGYVIEIPEQLRIGMKVGEYVLETKNDEIRQIEKIIKKSTFSSLGILARESEYLADFRKVFLANQKIHVMTMNEAQGVEFDVVILVGVGKDASVDYADMKDMELLELKKRIEKDLLYVALTRAISELHVMGRKKLENVAYIA